MEEAEAKKQRESLAASLDRHVENEDEGLREYRMLAEKIGNGPVASLIDLILTEEEQHHFLLRMMAKSLREPVVVNLQQTGSHNQQELLSHTKKLREHEEQTIEAFRTLKLQITGGNAEFLRALVDVITSDSEKHLRLLLAIEKIIDEERFAI